MATNWSTLTANSRIKNTIKLAKQYQEDPEKERREAEHRCLPCFYSVMIAGQAFTDSNCVSCNIEMTFCNTDTDKLCLPCAETQNRCVHCGAELDKVHV